MVCKLNRSLYGLKQAPRAWYGRFAFYLVSLDFVEAKSDTSMFILRRGDDIMLTASSVALQRTIIDLQREFAMNDLGPLRDFLEVIVEQRP
jgi:hypothetical protein